MASEKRIDTGESIQETSKMQGNVTGFKNKRKQLMI